MKNTKKYVLGLLALLIGASAQTSLSLINVRVLPAHKAKQRAAFAVRSAQGVGNRLLEQLNAAGVTVNTPVSYAEKTAAVNALAAAVKVFEE